jgi:tol-pal system protein YbgF
MLRLTALLVLFALPAAAQQGETLADVRAQLGALGGQIAALRAELTATGAQGGQVAGSALDRMNAIEAELTRLTAKTEEIEIRIGRIVEDGTNRLGDLEFRLVELEGGDVSTIGQTRPLGGDAGTAPGAVPAVPAEGGAELAVGEQGDFSRAKEALDSGSFQSAADLFAAFAETYPGGPLTGEALYWRGEALMNLGDTTNAARAWLQSFSDAPQGPRAPDALLKLGLALNTLGQAAEACVTLGEVEARYPGSAAAGEATGARARLGCG